VEPQGGGLIYVLQVNTDECGRLISGMGGSAIAEFSDSLKNLPVECGDASGDVAKEVMGLSQIAELDHPPDRAPRFQSAMGDIERIYRILRLITSEKRPLALEKRQDAKIRRIIDVIESLAGAPTCLDEIARQSALSKFHLCRLFRQATGMTVQTYLNELRISRACRMLAGGEKNVTEACFDCG
jgi:AraC-like DNA-binding protein